MPRDRWTRKRLVRMGFLAGRGLGPREIANDALIGSTGHAVARAAGMFGLAFPDRPEGGVMAVLPAPALRQLEAQARRRGEGAPELAGKVLAILASDPVLFASVLDDGK